MIKKILSALLFITIVCCGCGKKEPVLQDDLSKIKERGQLIVGVKVDTSGTSGGVMCLERREYHVEDEEYIVVGNETIDKPDDYEDGVQCAIITIEDVGLGRYDDGHLIANEAFIGVNDSRQNLQEVYVDRGTSASYEAFNILGEANTIEDLENYRDDWFRIKGKND